MTDQWPVEYIIYTATIPCALTGADISIFAAAFAYISDVSSIQNRTMRITILEVCYLVTIPTGIALGMVFHWFYFSAYFVNFQSNSFSGSFLFRDVLNRSYFIMFSINATILFVAILYSIFRLKVGIFVQIFG